MLVSCNNFPIHKKTCKIIEKELIKAIFSLYASLQVTLKSDWWTSFLEYFTKKWFLTKLKFIKDTTNIDTSKNK